MFLERMLCLVGYSLKNNHLLKMAKYRLTKNPKKSVNCEVLQENLNGYIVRFDNGMIKNVNKKNVYAFDRIDEAVLNESFIDDAKEVVSKFGKKVASVGRRIVDNIKKFFVKAFNLGGILVITDEHDNVVRASHPVNAILAAKMNKGINFIPSSTTISVCEEVGIEPEFVENYQFEGGYTGSYQPVTINESKRTGSLLQSILEAEKRTYNHNDEDHIRLEGKAYGLVDVDATFIANKLTKMYRSQFNGFMPGKATTAIPVIYGAPGIGKSAIIEGLKENIGGLGYKDELGRPIDINVITVNANNVNSETFTMPAQIARTIRLDDGDEYMETVIKDLPKSWLPMYDYLENDDTTEHTYNDGKDVVTAKAMANAVANGGGLIDDPKTGKKVLVNGPGGVFFIDEILRMTQFGKDSIMTIATSRTIGQGLRFGDRWVICAAANRPSDMSDEAKNKGFQAELADRTRFSIFNFVPDPNDWFKWAEAINSTKKPNVIPEVVKFIKSSMKTKNDYGYFYDAYNFGSDEDGMTRGDKAACTPRTWEAVSNTLAMEFLMDADANKTITEVISSYNNPGMIDRAINLIETETAASVGTEAAKAFALFMRSQCEGLKPNVARDLYINGVDTTKKESKDYISNVISRMSPEDWLEFLNESYLPMITGSLGMKPTQDGLINILNMTMFVINSYGSSSQNAAEMSTILKSVYAALQRSFDIDLDSSNNQWTKVSQHYLGLKNSIA